MPSQPQVADATDWEARRVAVLEGVRLKQQVVREVVDGSLSLRVAAAAFRAQFGGQSEEQYLRHIRTAYPARSEEESFCQYVIALTRVALRDRPDHGADVLRRLEEERECTQH
jgi:hypothetical protein